MNSVRFPFAGRGSGVMLVADMIEEDSQGLPPESGSFNT
jgi:hypothetical protein